MRIVFHNSVEVWRRFLWKAGNLVKSLRMPQHRLMFGEGRENTFSSAWPFNCTDSWSHSKGVPLWKVTSIPGIFGALFPLLCVSCTQIYLAKPAEQITVPVAVGSWGSAQLCHSCLPTCCRGSELWGIILVTLHTAWTGSGKYLDGFKFGIQISDFWQQYISERFSSLTSCPDVVHLKKIVLEMSN